MFLNLKYVICEKLSQSVLSFTQAELVAKASGGFTWAFGGYHGLPILDLAVAGASAGFGDL